MHFKNVIVTHKDGKVLASGSDKDKDLFKEALNKGYDVEVDVRFENNNFYLGHDTGTGVAVGIGIAMPGG